jgi:hypothetical protein
LKTANRISFFISIDPLVHGNPLLERLDVPLESRDAILAESFFDIGMGRCN